MPKRKTEERIEVSKKQNPKGLWARGLLETMKDPKYIVSSDDLITVILHPHPKAEFHYLVLPKERIDRLKDVKKNHEELLNHMENVAKKLVSEDKHQHRDFKIGYHTKPNMIQLHLHVISDDMNSAFLKNKKHWNSFTTDFFLKSADVLQNLKENGKVILPSEEDCKTLMRPPLKCHKCDYNPRNFPDLKKHILKHL